MNASNAIENNNSIWIPLRLEMKNRVLITDAVHPGMISDFEDKGWLVDYRPEVNYGEVKSIIGDYQGLIINSKINCDSRFLDLAIKLQFIGRLGSGREVVDIPYAQAKGIEVYFSPEGNKNAVAEHALGMLLALSNQLLKADAEVRQSIWHREARRGWELSGKTIGIIGFGQTGSQFAKKLSGLDMKVLTYDKYLNKGYAGEYLFIEEVTLESLINQSDIISFHLPLSEDTIHFANHVFFSQCKQGAIIINTSRGTVIETGSLIANLESKQLGGACLDVFENEKPTLFSKEEKELYQRLYTMENVVLSPHIAGWTKESKYLLSKILIEKIFPKLP